MAHNEKGDLATGDSNGTIYIWADGGNKITNFIKHAHDVSSPVVYDQMLLIYNNGWRKLRLSNYNCFQSISTEVSNFYDLKFFVRWSCHI